MLNESDKCQAIFVQVLFQKMPGMVNERVCERNECQSVYVWKVRECFCVYVVCIPQVRLRCYITQHTLTCITSVGTSTKVNKIDPSASTKTQGSQLTTKHNIQNTKHTTHVTHTTYITPVGTSTKVDKFVLQCQKLVLETGNYVLRYVNAEHLYTDGEK